MFCNFQLKFSSCNCNFSIHVIKNFSHAYLSSTKLFIDANHCKIIHFPTTFVSISAMSKCFLQKWKPWGLFKAFDDSAGYWAVLSSHCNDSDLNKQLVSKIVSYSKPSTNFFNSKLVSHNYRYPHFANRA